MHGLDRPITRQLPPMAQRLPKFSVHHGVELVDEYAWLRADNWQEVMRDPAVLDPQIRAYLEAENAYTEARAGRHGRAAGDALRRDEGAHQGGRQLGAGARRRLRVLRQLRHRRPVSAPVPAAARRRRARRSCSTATRRPRASPTGSSAPPRTAPTTSSSPMPSTTRARSSSRSASATWQPARTCPTPSPTRAAPSSGRATARRCSTSASTPTSARCTSTATASARRPSEDVLVYEEKDIGFYVGVGQTQSAQLHHHRCARPPDERGLPDRRRSARERARASSRRASTATSTRSSTTATA